MSGKFSSNGAMLASQEEFSCTKLISWLEALWQTVKFKVHMLLAMKITVLWGVVPCNLVGVTNVLEEHAVSVIRVTE
jgi:sulfite exporter TauE/SafE